MTKFHLLLRSLLLMDLRGQHYARATGAKPSELIPPLYWVVGQYLFITAVLSLALFTRIDVLPYAFVMLTVSALLSVSAVVVEFNEVALNFTDVQVIGHVPVPRRTYAMARFANLLAYLMLFNVALIIFPAIIGAGQRGAGWEYALAYSFAAGCANLFFPMLAILLYTLRPPEPDKTDLRDLVAWVQIILALVVFYGAQMMFRDGQHRIEMFLTQPPDWVRWLPTWWLAEWVAGVTQHTSGNWLTIALAIGLVTVLTGWLTLYRLATFYRAIRTGYENVRSEREPLPATWALTLSNWLAKTPAGRSSIRLTLTMLQRDSDLRMRMTPQLATVAAMLLLGLFTAQLGNPFQAGDGGSPASMSIVVIALLVMSVPTMMHNFLYSRDFEASWLLASAPGGRGGDWRHGHGVRRVLLWLVVLPVLLLLGLVFAWRWGDPLAAAAHVWFGWMQCVAVSYFALPAVGLRVPFSEPLARGGLGGRIAPFLAAVSLAATFMGFLEFFMAKKMLTAVLFAGLLLCLLVLAKYMISAEPSTVKNLKRLHS